MSYDMPLQEAIDRIDRIRSYRDYHAKAGQPQHALSQEEVDKLVVSWGRDPKLAKGVGRVKQANKTACNTNNNPNNCSA